MYFYLLEWKRKWKINQNEKSKENEKFYQKDKSIENSIKLTKAKKEAHWARKWQLRKEGLAYVMDGEEGRCKGLEECNHEVIKTQCGYHKQSHRAGRICRNAGASGLTAWCR